MRMKISGPLIHLVSGLNSSFGINVVLAVRISGVSVFDELKARVRAAINRGNTNPVESDS